jgi:hypothetical protein
MIYLAIMDFFQALTSHPGPDEKTDENIKTQGLLPQSVFPDLEGCSKG